MNEPVTKAPAMPSQFALRIRANDAGAQPVNNDVDPGMEPAGPPMPPFESRTQWPHTRPSGDNDNDARRSMQNLCGND